MDKREYNRQYYLANRERLSRNNKAYYLSHREDVLNYRHAYYTSNHEELLAKKRSAWSSDEGVRERRRAYRERNKERIAAYRKQYNKSRYHKYGKEERKRLREFLYNYKATHPCVDCGESDPIVLDFDHVRGSKKFNLSTGNQYALETIKQEIDKCEVRCANCHRRQTFKRKQGSGGGGGAR